jgi:hypothetical protein
LWNIFAFLENRDLAQVARVCKACNALISSPAFFGIIFKRDFPADYDRLKRQSAHTPWHELYVFYWMRRNHDNSLGEIRTAVAKQGEIFSTLKKITYFCIKVHFHVDLWSNLSRIRETTIARYISVHNCSRAEALQELFPREDSYFVEID